VNEFLQKNGAYIHALELNGLRNWEENRAVRRLADQWNIVTISGGDRHGVEPNANINLTHAECFTEFVHEIRREKRSNVLFMPQYAKPWKHRILQSTLDAIRHYPDFPQGSQRWDEARLSSGCQRGNTPTERAVAGWFRAAGHQPGFEVGYAAGLGPILRRPAHCLERVARVADGS